MSGDSNVTEQSSQGHLMAGKGDQQVGQSWCEGSRNKDRDQEETRKRRQVASPGHSGGMQKVPMNRWVKRSGYASRLQLGESLTAKFCLGLYVSSVIYPPATSPQHPAAPITSHLSPASPSFPGWGDGSSWIRDCKAGGHQS